MRDDSKSHLVVVLLLIFSLVLSIETVLDKELSVAITFHE